VASGHRGDEEGNGTDPNQSRVAGALHGILVFLPGQEDIESLASLLREQGCTLAPRHTAAVAPIFAALPTEQQMRCSVRLPLAPARYAPPQHGFHSCLHSPMERKP